MIDEAIEFVHRLLDLDLGGGEQVAGLLDLRRRAVEGGQARHAGIERRQGIALLVFGTEVHGLAAGQQDVLGTRQIALLLFQGLQLALGQGEVVEFFELVAEQLMAGALLVAVAGQAFQVWRTWRQRWAASCTWRTSSPAPAYSSSRRRWVSRPSSDWCSCWLWISISSPPRVLRSASGQGEPLI